MENYKNSVCIFCENGFVLSNSQIYEIEKPNQNNIYKGVCKKCWIKIGKETNWFNNPFDEEEIAIAKKKIIELEKSIRISPLTEERFQRIVKNQKSKE